MDTIQDISRRIRNAQDLSSIVRTMRALAMTSIRQYERAVESLEEYHRTTELGLHIVLNAAVDGERELPVSSRKPLQERTTGILVFGSDQGMCGNFNEQIAAYTVLRLDKLGIPASKQFIVSLGARVIAPLQDGDLQMREKFAMPSSVEGITPAVQELLLRSEEWRAPRSGQAVEQVFLFYNQLQSNMSYRPHMQRLLPINIQKMRRSMSADWPSRSLPIFTMEWQPLFSALLRQHLFFALFRAFAESLASENAARLMSMQTAERNIDERLEELNNLYHHRRQDAITGELLDIVSGFELLKDE